MKVICTNKYTLEKKLFAAATFKGLWVFFLFRQSKKHEVCLSLYESSWDLYRIENGIIFSLMEENVIIFWKIGG